MSRRDQIADALGLSAAGADSLRRLLNEFDVRDIAAVLAANAGAGGGSAFTGWTADEADPANVNSNGGWLDVGPVLTPYVRFDTVTQGGGPIPVGIGGSVDPSVAGLSASLGSLYLRNNGQTWVKTAGGDTDWTQLGGVPAGALKTVRVPLAFDTTDLVLTGIDAYTPSPDEAILWNMSYLSVSTPFDGTNPTLALTFTNLAGQFTSFGLGSVDSASGTDGHTLVPISTLDISDNIGIFPDTDPLIAIMDDGAAGDPNDPTPMAAGAGELVLVIVGV